MRWAAHKAPVFCALAEGNSHPRPVEPDFEGSLMRYLLTVPARINLLGNPGDALEGDFAVLSMAVDMLAGALVEPAEGLVLDLLPAHPDLTVPLEPAFSLTFNPPRLPLPYDDRLDLVKGAVNRLYQHSTEFRQKFSQAGIRISVWSEVPRQSGLGGSSLFVLLTLAALRVFYQLDANVHNDYVLSEIAQRVESKELGITCGFADRYVPLFGGLAYVDYRAKLHQHGLGEEPYATYERLDRWVPELPLVVASTGLAHDSGDVHGRLRPRYLLEHQQWLKNSGEMPPMLRWMSAAWETAWKGKAAMIAADWPAVGKLMTENHRLVDEMMQYCGFDDGAGWANNMFIHTALENGALGAKLTGAGSGGSVFALTFPGDEERLAVALQKAADEAGLSDAHIFRPRLSHNGLVVKTLGNHPTRRLDQEQSVPENTAYKVG